MSILSEAEALINGDRRNDYGSVTESFQRIADLWSATLQRTITTDEVAICMIQLKIARYQHGQQRDSIIDIAGYAGCLEKLVSDRTPKVDL